MADAEQPAEAQPEAAGDDPPAEVPAEASAAAEAPAETEPAEAAAAEEAGEPAEPAAEAGEPAQEDTPEAEPPAAEEGVAEAEGGGDAPADEGEALPQDEFTEAQRRIKERLKKLFLGTEGQDTDFLHYSLVADLLPSADVAWDELGLDWYTVGIRLDRLLKSSGPEGGETWENIWLSLSAEPTDLELEVAKLRAIFEASRNAKLERWEIEKGIQSEGISLEALQIPAAQMNDFVIGELEGEPGWTLEAFLGWFLMQKDAELAAAVEAEAAAQAEGERAEREAAEAVRRAAEEEERQQARKSQEAALLARLSLYDADSDAEDAEAMERNRVAEVSQWEAKDVANWVDTEIGLPQYRICFEANNFHGGRLLALTMDTLPRLSIRQFDHCKMIMNGVRRLKGIREKKKETLRDLQLGLRFDPPPQIHDKLKTLRFGSTLDYQKENRVVQEAYTTPVLLE